MKPTLAFAGMMFAMSVASTFSLAADPLPPATRPDTNAVAPAAKTLMLDLGDKVTMKLVLIPAGKFTMGSPESEQREAAKAAASTGANEAFARATVKTEGPPHEVTIVKPFYMGVYEVTQEQYEKVIGKNPSQFKGAQNPVDTVSWDDAVEFCKKLSAKTGKTVRLPTEAEWEYTCRAGSKTRFDYGNDGTYLGEHAWYTGNSDNKAHPVGQKKPNAWGLYDMHGNVSEWCSDYYADSYANAKDTDPQGPASGEARVARGGSWFDDHWDCKSASRNGPSPEDREPRCGFRVSVR
ncbi:MAG: formylglycine-generating enzyme family protein [Phycisphaerae bacterium]|nr:formylglycine-generating enzyme family protein [Phycisphaerae bacterium]